MKHVSEFIKEQKGLENYACFKWDQKAVKAFWDFEAAFDSRYFTHLLGPNIVALFEAELEGKTRILDYGAGKGFLTARLLERGLKVSCFDLSEETTKALNAKFRDNPNYLGSFTAAELENNKSSFDAILLIEVIEHLEEDARKVVLGQIHDLLKPGGIVIISTPNNENFNQNLICNPVTKEVYHRWQHVYSWTGKSLSAEIERYGFRTREVIETNLKYEGRGVLRNIKRLLKKAKSRLRKRPQDNLFVVSAKT
jgi:2-polyprenyl-3-methyl-5-hydroxy-6-metoxy-1,4-benzoquinol methylase